MANDRQTHRPKPIVTIGNHFSRRESKDQKRLCNTPRGNTNDNSTLPKMPCPSQRQPDPLILLTGRQNKHILIRRDNRLMPAKRCRLPVLEDNKRSKKHSSISIKASYSNRLLNSESQITIKSSNYDHRSLNQIKRDMKVPKPLWKRRNTSTLTMTSFSQAQKDFNNIVNNLNAKHRLNQALVVNLVIYVSLLTRHRSDAVDESVFRATLTHRMHMVANAQMFADLYRVLAKETTENRFNSRRQARRHRVVTVEAFCDFLCLLIEDDTFGKANVIFSVFDFGKKGYITLNDLNTIIKPLLGNFNKDDDESFWVTDRPHELTRFVMEMTDENDNRRIKRDEFVKKALEDKNFLHVFGMVLPNKTEMQAFADMLSEYEDSEMHAAFRNERHNLLQNEIDNNESFVQQFYPIDLDFV